jgi:cell division septum initiation protein DivIVA
MKTNIPLTNRTNDINNAPRQSPSKDITAKPLAARPSAAAIKPTAAWLAAPNQSRMQAFKESPPLPPFIPAAVVANSELSKSTSKLVTANVHTEQLHTLSDAEKVSLLGLALQQSNQNLESSHAMIRVLQSQVEEMKQAATMLIERMTKKANMPVSASRSAPPLPLFSAVDEPIPAVEDGDLPSPICSAPTSPIARGSRRISSSSEQWSTVSELKPSGIAEDNTQLRREMEEMKSALQEAEKLNAEKDAQIATLQSSLTEKDAALFTASQTRRKLADEVQQLKGNIRVVCRVRPKLEKEAALSTIVHTESHSSLVSLSLPTRPLQSFDFDSSLAPSSSQSSLFSEVSPLIQSSLDGFNVCLLAYGISGSGKTFSMEGTKEQPGMNRLAVKEMWEEMRRREEYDWEVKVQACEIHCEQIRDLLLGCQAQAEDAELCNGICEIQTAAASSSSSGAAPAVQLKGAVTVSVTSLRDVESALSSASSARSSASTQTNAHSSRSHSIVTLFITSVHKVTGTVMRGKLSLVDLAGSEDVSRSEVEGERLRETKNINKSLSALSLVFQALSQKQAFVPYRNSRLTHLLSDSLGGSSKSLLILCLNPTEEVAAETLQSLKFGQTVRTVRLGPAQQNKEPKAQRRASIAQHALVPFKKA